MGATPSDGLVDLSLSAVYRVTERITVEAGYNAAKGSVTFDNPADRYYGTPVYDGYSFDASAAYVKAVYAF